MAYQLNKSYLLFSHGGTGPCLTVYSGTASNNQNVCLFRKVGTSAQNWTIKAFGSNLKIVTGVNQNYALNYYWSAGQGKPGNCDIYPQSGNDADSSIVLEPVSTDVYRIKLKNYNLYLTAGGTGDNANVRWEAPVSLGSDYTKLAPQEWRLLDPAEKGIRAPFIYAGYYKGGIAYSYTDDQLSGLGNATEFVICSGTFNEYFDATGATNQNGYIQKYVVAATEMTRRLYNMYGKQVWIGTPLVGSNVPYTKAAYEEVGRRMTYFIDNLIAEFNNRGMSFATLVKGIYMSDETILDKLKAYASQTDGVAVTDCIQVKMFQTVSNHAAAKGKKMLWSPHWGPENIMDAAIVVHQTNIFDYAVIQPNYYFATDGVGSNICDGLRTGIAIQRVTYATGQPVLHESAISCTKTVIGCQMEIDWRYKTEAGYKERYDTYEKVFNQSYGAYSKDTANFGFYFACPAVKGIFDQDKIAAANEGYNVVKKIVNNFFQ